MVESTLPPRVGTGGTKLKLGTPTVVLTNVGVVVKSRQAKMRADDPPLKPTDTP